jgi:hypothetical protein
VANQRVPLKHFALDYFVWRRYVDHDVADYIYQKRLTFCAKLDSSCVQEPPTVRKHDGFRDLSQHELNSALDLSGNQAIDIDVAFPAPVTPLVQDEPNNRRLVVAA